MATNHDDAPSLEQGRAAGSSFDFVCGWTVRRGLDRENESILRRLRRAAGDQTDAAC